MGLHYWTQDNFSKGEITPLLYSRVSIAAYFNGLKIARNVFSLPQGAAIKRFGTDLWDEPGGIINPQNVLFEAFQYLDQCVYVLLWKNNFVDIYLEGIRVAQVATSLPEDLVKDLDFTILRDLFRISGPNITKPKDLTRGAIVANIIVSVASDVLTLTTNLTTAAGTVLPFLLTTSGTLPASTPQLITSRVYFLYQVSINTIEVYDNVIDARDRVNQYTITNIGTGVNNVVIQNAWAINDVSFENLPVFDFLGGYDSMIFTLGAMIGSDILLTSDTDIFNNGIVDPTKPTHVGGGFITRGGVARIISYTDRKNVKVDIIKAFSEIVDLSGRVAILTEPAWSDVRGWPQKCSSYQNRASFCNTQLLHNGTWLSVTNTYNNFNDLEGAADSAISWFPSSDTINIINFIVPYRSFTIHTNSGVYSTPLSAVEAVTPGNFSLSLQDSTPADKVAPRTVDNQIIIISGKDAHTLVWDGLNNAYKSSIISALNEQLLTDPVDEASFVDLKRAGSRYIFIVNLDGSMAIYQTLISEDVSGWTPAYLEQSYGEAGFSKVASNFDGRAWFLTNREIATAEPQVTITSYEITPALDGTEFTVVGSNISLAGGLAIKLVTTGNLPVTTPQVVTLTSYYWARGIDADNFELYLTQDDSKNAINPITIQAVGVNTDIIFWSLEEKYYIEELNFDSKVDMAARYTGAATSTVSNVAHFNAQEIKIQGDGKGFNGSGLVGNVEIEAHGASVDVSTYQAGFPIRVRIEPLPLSISMGTNIETSNLIKPKHIRNATFNFIDTIGGEVNGTPISVNSFAQVNIGEPPTPMNGSFEYSVMKGWDDFKNPTFVITHDEPFDFKLTGLFYTLET